MLQSHLPWLGNESPVGAPSSKLRRSLPQAILWDNPRLELGSPNEP